MKSIRMTDAEKIRMLKRIFSAPIKSPYMKRIPVLAFVYSQHTRVLLASCLVLAISLGGVTYASGKSLPGNLLYPIKTKVVEPMLDVVNSAPEKKIVWEEQKVTRRIIEAEMLAEKDELNDERLKELERNIEKSSIAFAEAINVVASSTTTSTSSARERAEGQKREFRRKINERKEVFNKEKDEKEKNIKRETEDVKRESEREKVRRLKATAIRVVDGEDDEKFDQSEKKVGN